MSRMSPARRHFLEQTAQTAGQSHNIRELEGYELQYFQLRQDQQTLSKIHSLKDKALKKAQLLPHYQSWLDGVMASTPNPNDEVFTTCLIWVIDTGDLDRGAELGLFAVENGMKLPDHFGRTMGTTVAEELTEGLKRGGSLSAENVERLKEMLIKKVDSPDGSDAEKQPHFYQIHDEVRAKFFKQVGFHFEADNKKLALELFTLAQAYDVNAGVKKKIETLEKALNSNKE